MPVPQQKQTKQLTCVMQLPIQVEAAANQNKNSMKNKIRQNKNKTETKNKTTINWCCISPREFSSMLLVDV